MGLSKSRKCRNCRKEYILKDGFGGCCSIECKKKRVEFLKKHSFKSNKLIDNLNNPYYLPDEVNEILFIKGVVNNNDLSDFNKIYLLCKEIHRIMRCSYNKKYPRFEKKLRKDKIKINSWVEYKKNKDELHALALVNGDLFYKSKFWLSFRYYAIQMFEKKCSNCGTEKNLHLDHIKPRSIYPELAFEISNMQMLCSSCNRGKGIGKNFTQKTILRKKNL